MARKILAGTLLALIALACGLTVSGDAAPTYHGNQSWLPNDGNMHSATVTCTIYSDTTAVAHVDTISPDGKYVYAWTIEAINGNLFYRFSPLGGGSTTEWDIIVQGRAYTWDVQTDTVFVAGRSATATDTCRYAVRFHQDKF